MQTSILHVHPTRPHLTSSCPIAHRFPQKPRRLPSPAPVSSRDNPNLELKVDLENLKQALRSPTEELSNNTSMDVDPDPSIQDGIVPERVLLVGLSWKNSHNPTSYTLHESLDELASLAKTAGLNVVGTTYQFVDTPSPATYVGSGKLKEIAEIVKSDQISTVIFDEELSSPTHEHKKAVE